MKGEQKQIQEASRKVGKNISKEKREEFEKVSKNVLNKQMMPKDALGMSDAMVEGIYGQAYRLYNTGKYKDASQLFRLLVMLNSAESRYAMGLAACFHMMKEYKNAANTYQLCGIIDPESPVPHYHASDCFIQMKDPMSAMISLEMAVKRAGEKPEFKSLKDRCQMTIESLKKEMRLPETEEKKPSKKKKKKKKKK